MPYMISYMVYPDTPLTVAAGATGPSSFAAFANGAASTFEVAMYLRFLAMGPDGPPQIRLRVGGGPEVTLSEDDFLNVDISPGEHIAAVLYVWTGVPNVYELRFYPADGNNIPGTTWDITFDRTAGGTAPQTYTWVVADNDAEASQPWIHVPDTAQDVGLSLGKQLLTGQSYAITVPVDNWGTGDLTIDDAAVGTSSGAYTLDAISGAIPPGGSGSVTFTFAAPPEPGVSATTFDLPSDDQTPGHDAGVQLTATAGSIEIVFLLDASGSMSWRPDGSSAPTPGDSRYYQLGQAASYFLNTTANFASTHGRFAVAFYPNVSGMPAALDASVVVPPDDIPADMTSAIDKVKTQIQTNSTPMGHGVFLAAGSPTTSNDYGLFLGADPTTGEAARTYNHRWLVLMTDGYHNLHDAPPVNADYYAGKSIRAITVAYGDGPASTDHSRLTAIATASGGSFLDAGPGDLATDIFAQFTTALKDGLALGSIMDPEGALDKKTPVAQHAIAVTRHDGKLSFVVNWARASKKIEVLLISPLGEKVSPGALPKGVVFQRDDLYQSYFVDEPALRNDEDPASPRYGTWRLVVRCDPEQFNERELSFRYNYQVLTESRLGFVVSAGAGVHPAGDPIQVRARLALDGLPLGDASVKLQIESPLDSELNWLAGQTVSAEALRKAQIELRERKVTDITALFLKKYALMLMGLTYTPSTSKTVVPMIFDPADGLYKASIPGTKVQGTYRLNAIAVGADAAGEPFRREQRVDVGVTPAPDPKWSPVDIALSRVDDTTLRATLHICPRDRFGNVILIDPKLDNRIEVKTKGAKIDGGIRSQIDGCYYIDLIYSVKESAFVSVWVLGTNLLKNLELPNLSEIVFADKVIGFRAGGEAIRGANKHGDPSQVLGDVTAKPDDAFVSLGAYGELAVAVPRLPSDLREITVFVRPDVDLRAYRVEVTTSSPTDGKGLTSTPIEGRDLASSVTSRTLASSITSSSLASSIESKSLSSKLLASKASSAKWIPIGTSLGTTQTFVLDKLVQGSVSAVRIVDASGRTRGPGPKPSESPGVSVRGIGFST